MIDLRFEADVRVDESPAGPVVRPPVTRTATQNTPGPAETVVLYLHSDRYLSSTVVCGRYRPAFPAALEDVYAGYCSSQAAGPVVVVGERAGAQLAAALLIRLRDSGAPPPRCAVLVSALLDLNMQAPSLRLNAAADPTFAADRLRRHVTRYAAGTAPTDPVLSPLRANLHGLPPVQLLVAGTDLLLDDSLAFAARAARSGVTVDLRVRPDAASLQAEIVPAMTDFITTWARTTRTPQRA